MNRFDSVQRVVRGLETGDWSSVSDTDVAAFSPSPADAHYKDWHRTHPGHQPARAPALQVPPFGEVEVEVTSTVLKVAGPLMVTFAAPRDTAIRPGDQLVVRRADPNHGGAAA
jgi:hypothetical protein